MTDGTAKPYLTPNEVARMLMVSAVTIRQWSQKGILPAETTVGGHRRYLRNAVERFAREHQIALIPPEQERGPRILIVDDDQQLVHYLVELLTTLPRPPTVKVAYDGFEAGQMISQYTPTAILLDLRMPGVDGLEICRRLKKNPHTSHINIVGMTGDHRNETVEAMLAAGATYCLHKPLEQSELFAALGLFDTQTTPDSTT